MKTKEEPVEKSWEIKVSSPDEAGLCSVILRIGVQSFPLNMGSDGLRPKEEAEWYQEQITHAIYELTAWVEENVHREYAKEIVYSEEQVREAFRKLHHMASEGKLERQLIKNLKATESKEPHSPPPTTPITS